MTSLFAAALFGLATTATASGPTPAPAGKPVLIVLTSHGTKGSTGQPTGFYLGEVTHPLAVFDAAGIAVEFASIQGGEPPVDGVELDDATNARYWNDAGFRAAIRNTARLDQVDSKKYAAVFYAGGHGAAWDFPDSPAVQRVTREIYESGDIVAAVCHGPSALVNVKLSDGSYLVAGKRISAFTDDEERAVKLEKVVPFLLASTLSERGALHQGAPNWTSKVVVDGRLVTGQNPQSATATAEAVRDLLRKPDAAD
jgi:putative intracellular protease/amidase